MIRSGLTTCILIFGMLVTVTSGLGALDSVPEPIDFGRDIRPILSDRCFECHGPDEATRKASLRLDTFEDAVAETVSGARAIVPGDVEESELLWRITSEDELDVMPPPGSGNPLTPEEVELIRAWIEQGAEFDVHWAFQAPIRPDIPQLADDFPVRNDIDPFILSRLEREGLTPSPEANRTTLIRRLSLDLIGLPPTPEEVEAFVGDASPNAYESLVERLLASPHYGERWGRIWLDAARYADSDGFEKDKPRQVWNYRDWVINALNRDLPYDQFIIEQIAGDLLPNATQDQHVATGFLRNSMINEEGGIDPEQFRMEAMFDRMDAIGKGMLGLTIQCAQCHTHKYDPILHEDYYRMFAFLNNAHESNIPTYTPQQQLERAMIFQEIGEIEAGLRHESPDWAERMASWEEEVQGQDKPSWTIVRPDLDTSGGQKVYLLEDGSILAAGYSPSKETTTLSAPTDAKTMTAVRLELLNDPSLPLGGPGRSFEGLAALSEFKVSATPADGSGKTQELKFLRATADVNPPETELAPNFHDKSKNRRVTGPIEFAIDGDNNTAWGIDIGPGRSNVPREAVFVLEKPIELATGAMLTFRLVQSHGGWNSNDNQNQNLGRYRLSITDAAEAEANPIPAQVREILAIPANERSKAQMEAVFSYWRRTVPEWVEANEQIESLWNEHPQGASQLVLMERSESRSTRLLDRGEFTKPKQEVEPGVPDFLHPLPEDASPDRLGFARWLVDRQSPTTARSIVNRIWQTYFGTGIVATSEDLGMQSEAPSHPELFDWLAVEFMENGWSLKDLHRLIVNSATYRQSSVVSPDLISKDPYNRLLARGPRFRVEAEAVRDIALAASGLLNPAVGGPSVYPPAPEFLFLPPASYGTKTWNVADGPERYRRALYTFRYRSVPFPALEAFDAPNGDASCVRRTRSNTPMQALVTLNEPLFIESARALAWNTLNNGGDCDTDRLAFAFRRCVAREPNEAEAAVLLDLLNRQVNRFSEDEEGSWTLATDDPANPPKLPDGVRPAQLAAWTAVSRVLLNLDETITKE